MSFIPLTVAYQRPQIITTLFQYLQMLRTVGPMEDKWKEMCQIQMNEFIYSEPVCTDDASLILFECLFNVPSKLFQSPSHMPTYCLLLASIRQINKLWLGMNVLTKLFLNKIFNTIVLVHTNIPTSSKVPFTNDQKTHLHSQTNIVLR